MAMRSSRTANVLLRSTSPVVTSFSRICCVRYRSVIVEPDVRILEVGPRDGLQNITTKVDTPVKIELIRRLADAGCRAIESASFVSPKWIPQLADSPEVMKEILPMAIERSIRIPVLTPNMKGFERAVQSGAKEAVVFASASEGFSWKNTNCSIEEALTRAEEIVKAALAQGMRARGVISCIFACPYDGPTNPAKVLDIAKCFLQMGCYEVGLGDTIGVGTVADTERLLRVLLSEIPADRLAGHYHDTYGQAVANIAKSYEMGLRAFDSSVAGLGGCPYAKGATGNVASEDVVYMFDRAGVSTGIDVKRLAETGDWISKIVNVKNNSRAGSAIVAKAQSETVAKAESTEPTPKLAWETVSDDGEHRVSRAGSVVKVTLTRIKNGNALSNSMMDGIIKLFDDLAKDKTVFQVILEAEGKYFCTGMDLSAGGSTAQSDNASVQEAYYRKVEGLFAAITNSPQITIAKVDGKCFGGGVGLAFACDVRLVSPEARFTMTEVKLGLSPATISRHMIREWGIPFCREAMLSGRTVTPQELQRIGVVHGIAASSDDLDKMVMDYIASLKGVAPRAAAAVKDLVRMGWTHPGKEEQTQFVKHTFLSMMEPGSEGEFGMAQFRKKIKTVDWAEFWGAKNPT